MRRLRENGMLEAEIDAAGDVHVEDQHVGRLEGFRFAPDASADGSDGKALRAAAQKALSGEIAARAERLQLSADADFVRARDGVLRWRGATVARLAEGDDPLRPRLILLADELLNGAAREAVEARLVRQLNRKCGRIRACNACTRDSDSAMTWARQRVRISR
jgi:ATP-dependent RNA helicase SUPV3L1/SUV3